MNIFYLHTNPDLAARLHCDKHVVKMILESAVFSYRLYYKLEKQHILKYTKRLPPEWLE